MSAAKMYPTIAVQGRPRERGQQYGETARERVRRSILAYHDICAYYTGGWTWEQVCAEAAAFEAPIERYEPAYLQELRGIAEGAGVEELDVLAIWVRTEVIYAARARDAVATGSRTLPPECSCFALMGSRAADGRMLIGTNDDWLGHATDTAVLLEVRREDGPNFVTLTEAGRMAGVGMNAAGIGLVGNALVSEADRGQPGVPMQVLLRAIYDCETIPDALMALQRHERASSLNYLVAHEDGLALDVEAAPGDYSQVWLGQPEDGLILHTNHFVNPGFRGRDASVYATPDSPTRLERLRQLVEARKGERLDREFFMKALADHAMYPHSLCAHADPQDPPETRKQTLGSMIMDLAARRMWLACGNPCTVAYEDLDYSRLLRPTKKGTP
jgi:isopenicillin-N N-acyltransferase-like protein